MNFSNFSNNNFILVNKSCPEYYVAIIQKNAQTQLIQIEANKREQLSKLNEKILNADNVKHSFGYIGIIYVSFLYGAIFLNDLLNIYTSVTHRLKTHRMVAEQEKIYEKRSAMLHSVDMLYSDQLDYARIKSVHLHLLRKKYAQTEKINTMKKLSV